MIFSFIPFGEGYCGDSSRRTAGRVGRMARVRCFKDKLCPYIAARRGLSRKEKKDKKETDLWRPPTRSFM